MWWVLIFCRRLRLRGLRLDHVGIQGALGQEIDLPELRGLLLEDPDELVADDPPLLLGILDARQAREEPIPSVDHHQPHAEIALERDPQELRLALAHQPVVDVDAGQLVADRSMHERRGDRAVDAARERTDDMTVADALADLGDRRLDEVRRRPRLAQPGDADDEVAQDLATNGRVDHLGVELDAVEVAARIGQAGVGGRIGLRRRPEAFGRADDLVAVAHPHRLLAVDPDEQPVRIGQGHRRRTVLALLGRRPRRRAHAP